MQHRQFSTTATRWDIFSRWGFRLCGWGRSGSGRALVLLLAGLLSLPLLELSAQEPPPFRLLDEELNELAELLRNSGSGLIISEAFMQRLVANETCEEGPVRDQILGADVVGTQSTKARTEFDFVPQAEGMEWFMHLRGTTRNCTTSYTPQAILRSEGEYRFQISKQIDFRGNLLETRSPAAFIESRQRNLGATTPATGVPIVGPLIGMAAFQQAENRRPLAERIAAYRLTQQIAPRFNDGLDAELAQLNQRWQDLKGSWPAALGPLPELVARSGQQWGFLALEPRLGAGTTLPRQSLIDPGAGVAICLSSERVNEWIRQLPLAGKEISDAEISRLVSFLGGNLTPTGPSLPGAESPQNPITPLATLLLDSQRPLQLDFQNERVEVEVRFGLRLPVGEDLPSQKLRFALQSVSKGTGWTLRSQIVELVPVDPARDLPAHELVRQVLRQQLEARLVAIDIPRRIPLPEQWAIPHSQAAVLDRLNASGGWLVLVGFLE